MKYIRNILVGVICLQMTSCSRHNDRQQPIENVEAKDTITYYDLEVGKLNDTLTYQNLIESVKYVTLETSQESALSDILLQTRKIGNYYCLKTGLLQFNVAAKLFDDKGIYVDDIIKIGRGHTELYSMEQEWTSNDNTGKITFLGPNKIINYDINSKKLTPFHYPEVKNENAMPRNYVALNNGCFISVPFVSDEKEYKSNKLPHLYLFDSTYTLQKELYYPNKRNVFQYIVPGVTENMETWNIAPTQDGNVLFCDVFNDTLYIVDEELVKKPTYVFSRNERQRPDVKMTNADKDQNKSKIYFKQILEANDYLLLESYTGNNGCYNYIWNKKTSRPIYVNGSVADGMSVHLCVSFDGFSGMISVAQIIGNTLITAIPANKLMNVLPGLKEDDNPVVVEIKLKDNYTPAQ